MNIIERDGRIPDECFHESEEVLDALVLLGFADVDALIYDHALSSDLLADFRELLEFEHFSTLDLEFFLKVSYYFFLVDFGGYLEDEMNAISLKF